MRFFICPDASCFQNGNGKGQMKKEYTFRPWPNAYLVLLTDASGKPLDAAAQTAYQNPGY